MSFQEITCNGTDSKRLTAKNQNNSQKIKNTNKLPKPKQKHSSKKISTQTPN